MTTPPRETEIFGFKLNPTRLAIGAAAAFGIGLVMATGEIAPIFIAVGLVGLLCAFAWMLGAYT